MKIKLTVLFVSFLSGHCYGFDYKEFIGPCFINKTREVGVIKDLRHCPVYLDAIAIGETIPRVCDYEICKDFVCCPINPNRLNQLCDLYDDPRHDLHYKVSNQFKCTVASTGQVGMFQFSYLCRTETSQKICDYEECNNVVCCPLSDNSIMHTFDINFDFTELVGGLCYEQTTDSYGFCRYIGQCPNASERDYTFCGNDHCASIICCPEPDYNTLQVSGRSCSNYKKFIYDRVKPFTRLIPRNSKRPNCFAVSPSGGTEVEPKEFPSMAALGYEISRTDISWNCGGTLISDLFVLTAGHCLYDANIGPVKHVRLGALNLIDRFKSCPEDFLVSRTIAHPYYSRRTVYNDIGLIQLNRKVHLNPFMVPACLPQTDYIPRLNDNLIALGWGQTSAFGQKTEHLLKVYLNYYTNSECNYKYRFNRDSKLSYGIHGYTQICAGSRNSIQDTCPGDSGGPLLIFHSDFYRMHTIIGVTSFGKSCGFANNPAVYTKVFPYVQWIENIVWRN